MSDKPADQSRDKTDKSVETRRSGFGDIKGGEADKPGQSPHDEKKAPGKTGEDR